MPDGRRRAAYGKGAWRSIGDGFSLLEKREREFGAFARLQALVATKDFAAGHDSERDARLKREGFSLTERGTIRRCVENGSLRDLGRSDETGRQRIHAVALRYGDQRGGGRERLRAPAHPLLGRPDLRRPPSGRPEPPEDQVGRPAHVGRPGRSRHEDLTRRTPRTGATLSSIDGSPPFKQCSFSSLRSIDASGSSFCSMPRKFKW